MRVDTAPEGEDLARENWSKHEQKTPPHALSGIQGEGGAGRRPRRQDALAHCNRSPLIIASVVAQGRGQLSAYGQPHELDVALGFALQAPAGLDAIEIAVDVDLQRNSPISTVIAPG